ncbi:MAG: penicillin-binding protein 2 [Peptococcaceae bacterium]|jgi:peptidoglycan glycosyltransferase|nr:penicillin-binding protein 2 [Peptococcaceae bacterium]
MSIIRRLALILAFSFFVLSLGLVYWQVVQADELVNHPANRRLILMEGKVARGGIFDRNGEVLAQSIEADGSTRREYPKGEMMEPLLGYATLQHGSAGLESALAELLLGQKYGTPGQQLQRFFDLPRQGNDVVLSLDAGLQKTAYQGLQGKTGSVVALDPRTGQVLALASQPSYSPNQLEENWAQIIQQTGSPLQNHAFSLFPPGSIMKVVTSKALFTAGIDTTDLFHCEGSVIINGQRISEQNGKEHGWVNYNLALADSCNTYFSVQAVESGARRFLAAARDFGFGKAIPFELPITRSSITNTAGGGPIPDTLDENMLAASAFGQGQVLVSPFHMALITAGIANHGVMMKPYIVERVLAEQNKVTYQAHPEPWLTALTEEQAKKITSAMITAVNEGTAAPGAISSVQVAAKTGSAEPGGDVLTHAWYIAFAPAEAPRIAVVVMIENGGTGGGAAAPIARNLIIQALSGK